MGQEQSSYQSYYQYGGDFNQLLKSIKSNPDPLTARNELLKLDKNELRHFINHIDMNLIEGNAQNYARGNILSRIIWIAGEKSRKTISIDFEMLDVFLDNLNTQTLLTGNSAKGYIKYAICILNSSCDEIMNNAANVFSGDKYKTYLNSYKTIHKINDELRYKLFCKIIKLYYSESLNNNLIINQCKSSLQLTYAVYITNYIDSFVFNHNNPSKTETNFVDGETFTVLSCDPFLNLITDPESVDKQIIGTLISSLVPITRIVAKFGENILDDPEVILISYFNVLFSDPNVDISEYNSYIEDFSILSKHDYVKKQLQLWFNKNYKSVSSSLIPIIKRINPGLTTPKDKEPVIITSDDIRLPKDFIVCKQIFQKVKAYAEKTNNNELKDILQFDPDMSTSRAQTGKTGRLRKSTKK